eukprot:2199540-Prymnesium_polylepis.1
MGEKPSLLVFIIFPSGRLRPSLALPFTRFAVRLHIEGGGVAAREREGPFRFVLSRRPPGVVVPTSGYLRGNPRRPCLVHARATAPRPAEVSITHRESLALAPRSARPRTHATRTGHRWNPLRNDTSPTPDPAHRGLDYAYPGSFRPPDTYREA